MANWSRESWSRGNLISWQVDFMRVDLMATDLVRIDPETPYIIRYTHMHATRVIDYSKEITLLSSYTVHIAGGILVCRAMSHTVTSVMEPAVLYCNILVMCCILCQLNKATSCDVIQCMYRSFHRLYTWPCSKERETLCTGLQTIIQESVFPAISIKIGEHFAAGLHMKILQPLPLNSTRL